MILKVDAFQHRRETAATRCRLRTQHTETFTAEQIERGKWVGCANKISEQFLIPAMETIYQFLISNPRLAFCFE